MINIFSAIISSVGDFFSSNIELKKLKETNKLKLLKAKSARDIARVRAESDSYKINAKIIATNNISNSNLDKAIINMRKKSYMDEIIIILIMSPAILVFVPKLQPYIEKGFKILDTLPDYYKVLLIIVVVMTVGGVGVLRDLLGIFRKK